MPEPARHGVAGGEAGSPLPLPIDSQRTKTKTPASREVVLIGGAWLPDSPWSPHRPTSLRRIGVPGILTGSALRMGRDDDPRPPMIGHPFPQRAHLPEALPEVAPLDNVGTSRAG